MVMHRIDSVKSGDKNKIHTASVSLSATLLDGMGVGSFQGQLPGDSVHELLLPGDEVVDEGQRGRQWFEGWGRDRSQPEPESSRGSVSFGSLFLRPLASQAA